VNPSIIPDGGVLLKNETMNRSGAVSPIALDKERINPVRIPGKAFGNT
jgi:hypothetical protein